MKKHEYESSQFNSYMNGSDQKSNCDKSITQKTLWLSAFVSTAFFTGCGLIFGGKWLIEQLASFDAQVKFIIVGIVIGLITSFVGFSLYRYSSWIRKHLPSDIMLMVRRLDLIHWLIIAIMASFSEEIFFRGMMQPILGILITNVIFGYFHFLAQRKFLGYGISAFVMGIILSFVYFQTSSIWCVMFLHATHNLSISFWVRKSGITLFQEI